MQSRYKSYQTIERLGEVVGEEVTLRGWVDNLTGKGKLQFLKLRDGSGICQCVRRLGSKRKSWLGLERCL